MPVAHEVLFECSAIDAVGVAVAAAKGSLSEVQVKGMPYRQWSANVQGLNGLSVLLIHNSYVLFYGLDRPELEQGAQRAEFRYR